MACCQSAECPSSQSLNSPRWRRALWIALAINASFFVIEIVAGAAAGSVSLQADALDFLGDAANYGVSLGVAGMALAWRARASLLKGATLGVFGVWILGVTLYNVCSGTGWPDLAVGSIKALLSLSGAWQICRHALSELRKPLLREPAARPAVPAE
ncbi:MAG: hypothetical protein LCH93_03755 [Proteobacteria bacterium]|nr:hypothetical protein [Pseudomonadota bacterium]